MYLLAGGRDGGSSEDFLREAFRACGSDRPAVAYIGTANGERAAFLNDYMAPMLLEAGAASVTPAPLLDRKNGTETARRVLLESDVIFLAGGEVEDGILGIPGDVKALLRQLYETGKVFVGVSAGTIMLGIAWPHWDDEESDPENAVLFDCLGFAPTIFDTHCEGENWVELRKAVSLSPEGFTGYGIPSGGAVRVSPDGALHPTLPLDAFRSENGAAVYVGKYGG